MDLGDTLNFRSDVYDKPAEQGGVLVNATGATLTITLPDGSAVSPSVTNPPAVTGKYTVDYVATLPGRHVGQWLFTMAGGKTTSYVETFDVGPSLVTVDEAVAHLRAGGIVTSAADLEQVQWLCFVATDAVERDLGRALTRRTVTETHNGGTAAIVLRQSPVLSVTTVLEGGVAVSSVAGYVIDSYAGILYRGSQLVPQRFWTGRQNITVTYVVGFLNPPPVARMVALTCLQSMWQESQQASHPLLDESAEFAVSNAVAGLPGPLRQAYDSLRTVGVA